MSVRNDVGTWLAYFGTSVALGLATDVPRRRLEAEVARQATICLRGHPDGHSARF